MDLNQPYRQPSALREKQPQGGEKPKKRTSFSQEVKRVEQLRRVSGISIPASDHTTDDSNKSNDASFDFWPRTSSFKANNGNSNRKLRAADKHRFTTKSAASDSTIGSRSTSQACFPFGETSVIRMKKLLNSKFWKVLISIFTLILIWGGSLRFLFPVGVDPYFDIAFIFTFAIMSLDIMMMCYTVPLYFVFSPTMNMKKRSDESGCMCFSFQFGSFNFWFDVISVTSLLLEISYINNSNEVTQEHIYVDHKGMPTNTTDLNPFVWDHMVVSVILRTARVARLVRIDYIATMQAWTANLTKSIRRRKDANNSATFGLRFGKYGENNAISEEMHEAATKIQREWKKQTQINLDKDYQHCVMKSDAIKAFQMAFQLSSRERNGERSSSRSLMKGKKGDRKKEDKKLDASRNLRFDSIKREKRKSKKKKSHIGSAMNEMTMRRVGIGLMIGISVCSVFTYVEPNMSRSLTVLSMHNTLSNLYNADPTVVNRQPQEILDFLWLQTKSSTPDMFNYQFHTNDGNIEITFKSEEFQEGIREWEKLEIQVCKDEDEMCTVGSKAQFVRKHLARHISYVSLIFIFFLILVWIAGLLFFVGPVTTLVVYPIERMIRLLSMLVKDPLGYSKTKKYRQFMREDEELSLDTMWTRESLNGMETSFLMSTILRIGSLMKVGFGSAGVEIIRSNLQRSTRLSISLTGSSKRYDSTVACIFMFCDIRGFTDSSECLNEEVFVFTNRIAAVVHSYCHAYGGSANKNIGDAFLLSWQLDKPPTHYHSDLYATKRQADKALLSVVKICIALYNESFFLEGLSKGSIDALKRKFAKRPGNLVQLGFGLHAGKAVEGAIGSQRKLDATYLSEAVELAEYLESSTKKYGVSVLMSGKFYSLLHKTVREKCRKIDHIFFTEQYEDDDPSSHDDSNGFHMSLHTFDMDIDSLFHKNRHKRRRQLSQFSARSDSSKKSNHSASFLGFRSSSRMSASNHFVARAQIFGDESSKTEEKVVEKKEMKKMDELQIPDGNLMYSHKVWQVKELTTIREKFTHKFYRTFNEGYKAYISSDWEVARKNFEYMVEEYNDKPSQVFLDKMSELNDKPPQNFVWRKNTVSMEYH